MASFRPRLVHVLVSVRPYELSASNAKRSASRLKSVLSRPAARLFHREEEASAIGGLKPLMASMLPLASLP